MKLFRVTFKVRPATGHPQYWEVQAAYLIMEVFAADSGDAGERAEGILSALLYELVSASYVVIPAPAALQLPWEDTMRQLAMQTGLGIVLSVIRVGEDESAQFADPDAF